MIAPERIAVAVIKAVLLFTQENYETAAGFMMYMLRKVPKRIESVESQGARSRCWKSTHYRIDQLLVKHLAPGEAGQAASGPGALTSSVENDRIARQAETVACVTSCQSIILSITGTGRLQEPDMIVLSPSRRRLVYVLSFELVAIALSGILLALMYGGGAADSLPMAVAISLIAVVWNYVFNLVFEAWERAGKRFKRTAGVRALHAIAFELGLTLITLPLYMVWYDIGVWHAFKLEAGILLFFLVYTYVFTLVFDRIFSLSCCR